MSITHLVAKADCRSGRWIGRTWVHVLHCLLLVASVVQSQGLRPWLPEVLSAFPNVRDMTISPDGHEYYFTVESMKKEFSAIVLVRLNNGIWSAPVVAPFSGQYRDLEPAFSPSGRELFFVSTRPLKPGSSEPKDYDIWYVTRENPQAPWSDPKNLGAPVNTDKGEYYPSLTMWGDLYFTRESEDVSRKEDIFVSRKVDGDYSEPEALSDAVNSDHYEFNAFIAPDESFLMFTSYGRADDVGGGDLYISYRSAGKWQPARHMREMNSNRLDYCPHVDTRNNILYFTSERSAVPVSYDERQDLPTIVRDFHRTEHGAGRIYMTPFVIDAYR